MKTYDTLYVEALLMTCGIGDTVFRYVFSIFKLGGAKHLAYSPFCSSSVGNVCLTDGFFACMGEN